MNYSRNTAEAGQSDQSNSTAASEVTFLKTNQR